MVEPARSIESLQQRRINNLFDTTLLFSEPEINALDRVGASAEAELLETAMSRLEPILRAGLHHERAARSLGL